jgi:chaperonin cofactor prefoldin
MLAEQATEVLSRLQTAEKAKGGVEQAQELNELRKELDERLERLRQLHVRARLFRKSKIPLTPVLDAQHAITSVSEIANRFRESPASSTLKRGKRWSGLLATLDMLERNAKSRQAEDWKTFHSTQLFAGRPPEQIRVALTPKNQELLRRYTDLYRKFAAYRNFAPETAEAIEEVRKSSDALAKIKFDENVPRDVEQFFEATASSVGASLELLKPSVIDWLRSNNLIGTFVVRSRIN